VYESYTVGENAADTKKKKVLEKKIGDSEQALGNIAAENPCGFTVSDI